MSLQLEYLPTCLSTVGFVEKLWQKTTEFSIIGNTVVNFSATALTSAICEDAFWTLPRWKHNVQNYDMHHVILSLEFCESTTTASIIPQSDEKYISLSLGVLVNTYDAQVQR